MKKEYISPEMEITKFDTEDVITTSGDGFTNANELGNPNGEGNIQYP